ncbi:MAG: copper resistance protein CopC [Acidobacteria bacterium]|nr:copper resistance protein CopC [Acidobacteriota bacterium]
MSLVRRGPRRAPAPSAVFLAALVILVTVVGAAPARAHAVCDRSEPADGAELDRAPAQASCDFTEPLAPSSTMRILDTCERRVDDGDIRITGLRMSVGMRSGEPSEYTVRWQATSLADGHTATGSFAFKVRGARRPCESAAPSESPSGARSAPTQTAAATPSGSFSAPAPPHDSHGAHDGGGTPTAQPGSRRAPVAAGSGRAHRGPPIAILLLGAVLLAAVPLWLLARGRPPG